jgi:hypothetical protein
MNSESELLSHQFYLANSILRKYPNARILTTEVGGLTSDIDQHITKIAWRKTGLLRQAFNALTTQAERAENAFSASRDAFALINRELLDLISTLRELETALSAVVDEETRLNRGRGRKRQRRATHKRGKKGKNTRHR